MFFTDLNKKKAIEIIPGYFAKFLHSGRMTISFWNIKKGYSIPEHRHPNEQIANCMEGRFELTIDGETKIMETGISATIPPDVIHSGKAITDCKMIDVFSPVREDYKIE